MARKNRRSTDLTPSEKNLIAQILLANNKDGQIPRGKLDEISASFGVHRRTVQYVWSAAKEQKIQEGLIMFSNGKQGLPHNITSKVQLDLDVMKAVPFEHRTTIRRLAREMHTSKSTVARWVKKKEILPHTNAIHPEITATNKYQRIKYSLDQLETEVVNNKLKYKLMQNTVHIDEKWFFLQKAAMRCYKAPGEDDPYIACKSKKYIPKVMFMSAVARPQFSSDGQCTFDGKIGIFPFTRQEGAQRNSRNRARGTLVTKQIDSITKEVIKGCLINQIIPAIKAKWPAGASKNIFIQQDNARPHINNLDPEFRAAASSDGFNIILVCQSPNSPDTNINDLGWFRAIESLQVDTRSYNVDDLVKNVILSFEQLTPSTLNKVFLSLQGCLTEILKVKGHNNFNIPHMQKDALIRQGTLPESLEVDVELVKECIEYLQEVGQIDVAQNTFSALLFNLGYA